MSSKTKFEIRKVLVLSTLHITPETLHHFKQPPFIGAFEYGAYFHVRSQFNPQQLTDEGCPDDLMKVLWFAHDLGCQEVKFDQDGEVYDGLVTFRKQWLALELLATAAEQQKNAATGPWVVSVSRVGYGARDISIKGPCTEAEAVNQALELAGDLEFSEHTSDYQSNGVTLVQQSQAA